MTKYLLLKHYRGGPTPHVTFPSLDQWPPDRREAHFQFMRDFADRLTASGEFVDGQAVGQEGTFVRYGGPGKPPVTEPFAHTKELIAGWMVIDVDSYDRALEVAGELSAAPGHDGEPICEWLELRPFLEAPPTFTE